jgi:hypothetical protein
VHGQGTPGKQLAATDRGGGALGRRGSFSRLSDEGGMADDERTNENENEDEDEHELYEEVERRALFSMDDDDAEPPPDVVDILRGNGNGGAAAKDVTLGGYIDTHDRVPAFEGSDGQPYTVDVDTEATGDDERPFGAFLVFIRWAATGAGIMDHVESGDVAFGASEEAARQAAMDLSLFEVKAELDAAIGRRRADLEE